MSPRPVVALVLMIAGGMVLPTPGRGAEITAGATPLALTSVGPAPGCPTAQEVDGSLLAKAYRKAAGPQPGFWNRYMASVGVTMSIATTVAVCDPDLVALRTAPGPITGSAASPPTEDTVGFGLRMLGAPITASGAAYEEGTSQGVPFSYPI